MKKILSTLIAATVLCTLVACDNSPQPLAAQNIAPHDAAQTSEVATVIYIFEGNTYTVSYTTSDDTTITIDSHDNEDIIDILDIPTLVTVIDNPNDTIIELYRNSEIANKEMNLIASSPSILAKSTGEVAATNGLNVKVYSEKYLTGAWTEFNYDHQYNHGDSYFPYVKLYGAFWDNKISSLFAYNPPNNALGVVALWADDLERLAGYEGESLYLKMGPGCPFVITNLRQHGFGTITIEGVEHPKPAWMKSWNNRTTSITLFHTPR